MLLPCGGSGFAPEWAEGVVAGATCPWTQDEGAQVVPLRMRMSPPPKVVWIVAAVLALLALLGALGVAGVPRPFWLAFLAWVLLAGTTLRGL